MDAKGQVFLQDTSAQLWDILDNLWPNRRHHWSLISGWQEPGVTDQVAQLGFFITIYTFKQYDALSNRFGGENSQFLGFPIRILQLTDRLPEAPKSPEMLEETSELLETDIETEGHKKITCWGCLIEQPNQLAHMDPGGCLYIESDLDL